MTVGQHIGFLPPGDDDIGGGLAVAIAGIHQGMDQAVGDGLFGARFGLVAALQTVGADGVRGIDDVVELQELGGELQGLVAILALGGGVGLVERHVPILPS